MKMHAQFENKGDGNGNCSKPVEVHFYRSKGYKEDAHSGDGAWKRVGTDFIQCDNIKPGMIHEEEEGIELWRDADIGISNIVACINHTQDDHNSVANGAYPEKHRSNDCSTEAVFEVTADGQVVNVPNIDFIAHSLQFLQPPSYAGDQARLGGYIQNIGSNSSQVDIRSSYSVVCPGTGTIYLTDDKTEGSNLNPGQNNWEETKAAVTMPNATGNCTAYLCADYQNAVTTEGEDNNCSTLPFTLQPRPAPDFIVSALWLREGSSIKKDTRVHPYCTVKNIGGPASRSIKLAYYINTGVFRDNDTVEASEIGPGQSKTENVKNNNIKLGDKGNRTYTCCVDYQGQVAESNEGNNCATIGFKVK
jgi:hypothetical protein